MSGPVETVWAWARTAPLPVVLALLLGLSGWVYETNLRTDAAFAAAMARSSEQDVAIAKMNATLNQVDTNVQTLLQAVLWQNKTAGSPRKEK